MQDILKKVLETVALYGPKLLGGIAVLIIGGFAIKAINKTFAKILDKRNINPSLTPFLKGIVSILLKVLLFISVMTMVGVEMMSFTALIAAAGLAVGMALSGTLQNFAGGVMILIFKPFKPGDFIDAQGYMGTVSEIQIFNTYLKTVDNKTIIIPNGGLSTGSMTNFSAEPQRRVDWTFGIGYGDDIDHAKKVIKQLCDADERILKDPEVFIAVSELGDSSVNFVVRAWVNAPDYWDVFFAMNETVYKTFEKEGLNIPYPQMDVHVHN
ncbi:MAG: mechanosensitive ion channel [Candidatus Marinimicrobia bacterium]|nr:mechanosensitive ion channel [Candidatus Neomarinimicrobiota bacterium]